METIELQRKYDLTLADVEGLREEYAGYYGAITYRRNQFWQQVYDDLSHSNGVDLDYAKAQADIIGRDQTSDKDTVHNRVTNQGLAWVLDDVLKLSTAKTAWYLTLSNTSTDATAASTYAVPVFVEITLTDVTDANRIAWTGGSITGTTTASVDNAASAVQYTCDTAGYTAWGAGLVGATAGNITTFGDAAATNGVLYSFSLFASEKIMTSTDTIDVTYTFTSTDV